MDAVKCRENVDNLVKWDLADWLLRINGQYLKINRLVYVCKKPNDEK